MSAKVAREATSPTAPEHGSITVESFTEAITKLQEAWDQVDGEGTGEWRDVRVLGDGASNYFLRIVAIKASNRAKPHQVLHAKAEDDHDDPEVDEPDNEALFRPTAVREDPASNLDGSPTVRYDIIFSPTYRVPTLYIASHSPLPGRSLTLSDIYDILVPQHHRTGMQAVGVMGGLTMTEHPVTGMTCWFVHPCRTGEALWSLIVGSQVEEVEYLMMWFGLIGASVGLEVPVAVAQNIVSKRLLSV